MKTILIHFIKESLLFGWKQAWASLYGGLLLLLILLTFYLSPQGINRYDFLFTGALFIQLLLLLLGLETRKEVQLIFVFHFVATLMELFKTDPAIGSWVYPGEGFFRIANVPLFTGFMYSAVGSYIARAWRLLELQLHGYPPVGRTIVLSFFIYLNFFTHHFIWDFRPLLFLLIFFLFRKTKVQFKVYQKVRSMPLLIGFFLIAFFIWGAENASTFSQVWVYPDQSNGWRMVSISKIGAWYLLMIISFVLVSLTKRQTLYICSPKIALSNWWMEWKRQMPNPYPKNTELKV